MKTGLNAEYMHSNKRRAIQHMDAKCPFTAPIQTQHPPPPGRCMAWWAMPPCCDPRWEEHAFPTFPTLHCALECFEMSACVAWIWATGEGGLWRGGGSQELPQRPSSADATSPLPARESEVAHGIWPPGPTLYPWSSLCICQNKVNPLKE